MDIGMNIAGTLRVHPHQVELTKELCEKSGTCRISVTLCSTDELEPEKPSDYGEESEEYETDSDDEEED